MEQFVNDRVSAILSAPTHPLTLIFYEFWQIQAVLCKELLQAARAPEMQIALEKSLNSLRQVQVKPLSSLERPEGEDAWFQNTTAEVVLCRGKIL